MHPYPVVHSGDFFINPSTTRVLMHVIRLIYCQIALMRLFRRKWRCSTPESEDVPTKDVD